MVGAIDRLSVRDLVASLENVERLLLASPACCLTQESTIILKAGLRPRRKDNCPLHM